MATDVIVSVGTRGSGSDIAVTVSSVSGSGTPWAGTATLSAAVPSTVNIGDKLDDGTNDYLITGISGSDLTLTEHPYASAGTAPATGAANVRRGAGSNATAMGFLPSDIRNGTGTDENWSFEYYNDGEISAVLQVPDCLTDSDNKITIRAATGESFKDHADAATNPLKYDATKGIGITASAFLGETVQIHTNTDDVDFVGMQFEATNSPQNCVAHSSGNSAHN